MAVNRSHEPVIIEEFMGLFKRGDADSCPIDHFSDCDNLKAIESGVETRDGLDTLIARGDVLRMYNYKMDSGESLIILTLGGDWYHALLDGSNTVYGPILSISSAEDFDIFVANGLCYITPFKTFTDLNGQDYQLGLENEFVYVYKGDGSQARKAAGFAPTGGSSGLVGYVSQIPGLVTPGIHIIGVTAIQGGDESGNLGPEGMSVVYVEEDGQINLNNIPLGPGGTDGRRIYMTQAIGFEDWNPVGDIRFNYDFWLAVEINDNVTINAVLNIADASLTVGPFVSGAGSLPTLTNSNMYAQNSATDGFCDLGLHVIGVVYETDTGYLTAPGPDFYAVQTFVNEQKAVEVHNIPVSSDPAVIRRHLVSTIAIPNFNGNNRKDSFSFQFFFIPDGDIDNNTDTDKTVSYYDADLTDDASHLIDNFDEIPAGTNLSAYGTRMVVCGIFDTPSIAYVSAPGEPEAIDQVDGQIQVPVDGNPLTMTQEFRAVLYLFKRTRTYPVSDNGDVPSTWKVDDLDLGIGCPVHGIAQVLDSGGANVDFLLVCDFSGVMLFNGTYGRPELSYKIQDYWLLVDRNDFGQIQILNDTILQRIYIALPNRVILYADYSYGLDPQQVRWFPWSFDIEVNTIALIETNVLAIGSSQLSARGRAHFGL
jgi:hypothetical protein